MDGDGERANRKNKTYIGKREERGCERPEEK